MWWRYALSIGVFLAVVLTIAVRVGLVLGRRSAREHSGSPAARAGVLVGEGWSDDAERRLVALMPYAMLVLTGQGLVRYLSPDVRDLGIVENDRLTDPGIEGVLRRVVADERVRELEIHVRQSSPRSVDGGGEGQDQDVDGEYLRVRAGAVGPNLYAVFLSDITEQRRFASMRRDFVTNVSHELKTPAGAISLLAETISDASDDATAVRYFAQRIIKESQRLTQLVHRLIDLQRVQDPQVVRNPEVLDVVALARDAIGMNLTLAQTGGVDLLLDLEGRRITDGDVVENGPSVRADRTALTTALKNLVENAIRYSPDRTAVNVDVRSRGERVLIRVIDRGEGIPKEALGRIFERFYRVDEARSRATGGSGLGLAIAKHGVEECGGTLSVWSHEGLGSTFTVSLPLVAGDDRQGADAVGGGPATAIQEEGHRL